MVTNTHQSKSSRRSSENVRAAAAPNGVLVLTLDRPKALNALSDALMGDLRRALAHAQDSPSIGAVVITGHRLRQGVHRLCRGACQQQLHCLRKSICKLPRSRFTPKIQDANNDKTMVVWVNGNGRPLDEVKSPFHY